ncbi:hypothetical protein NPIL_194211 [Nephila pilipes]|uniref:Uncharacterized protein n=1 Tax=Nephila pilipes TaxID=299642 RepID=A0A8X6Q151_NEPPI|nr:hypothetical protein NPIL_194211 [Nephila pilipes]
MGKMISWEENFMGLRGSDRGDQVVFDQGIRKEYVIKDHGPHKRPHKDREDRKLGFTDIKEREIHVARCFLVFLTVQEKGMESHSARGGVFSFQFHWRSDMFPSGQGRKYLSSGLLEESGQRPRFFGIGRIWGLAH